VVALQHRRLRRETLRFAAGQRAGIAVVTESAAGSTIYPQLRL
jgi:hypothetical protein